MSRENKSSGYFDFAEDENLFGSCSAYAEGDEGGSALDT
jgi:hypothetical protein